MTSHSNIGELFEYPETTFKTDHVSLVVSLVDVLSSHKTDETAVSFLCFSFLSDML